GLCCVATAPSTCGSSPLSLHDALPIFEVEVIGSADTYIDVLPGGVDKGTTLRRVLAWLGRSEHDVVVAGDTLNDLALFETGLRGDRKSTRLNSSHVKISYAVFCLKKKK